MKLSTNTGTNTPLGGDDKFIILFAPSGSGKGMLLKSVEGHPKLMFSVSGTTRQKGDAEVEGKDYYFFSPERFLQLVNEGYFLEWQEVTPGKFYGIPVSELARAKEQGKFLILDIDVKGAENLKKRFPNALLVFVDSGDDQEVYKARILSRIKKGERKETNEEIEERLKRLSMELRLGRSIRHQVVYNLGAPDDATTSFKKIIDEYFL